MKDFKATPHAVTHVTNAMTHSKHCKLLIIKDSYACDACDTPYVGAYTCASIHESTVHTYPRTHVSMRHNCLMRHLNNIIDIIFNLSVTGCVTGVSRLQKGVCYGY